MEVTKYIVKKRLKGKGLRENVNIPYGTELMAYNNMVIYDGKALCTTTSNRAHRYLAPNNDGMGKERGKLTLMITETLERQDKDYQVRWDKVKADSTCLKHQKKEHEDFFLWGHSFFEAPIHELYYIANLIGVDTSKIEKG